MPNVTTVHITSGVPDSGTGTVSTLDNLTGTAGSASAQVLTVQGVASMTAVKVDGSAVTQPVSGTVTASISGTVAATQSGTWTVQPGNTANTTAWKVDGSAVTQPVSYATTGSGTATGAIRVELPTNGTGVIATVGAVTSITNALPAGSNAIGKLSSNSGVTIGAVEIAAAQTLATVTTVGTVSLASDVRQGTAANLNATVVGAGTAGSANSGVITVQGIASMTALKVDGSAVTQPISAASASIASGAFASGSIGSGAVASGAIASGAVASGAFASGALASGSIASGAMVDLVAEQTPITPATATATKGLLLGSQYNSTQATFTNGQQGSVQISSRGEVKTNIMDAAANARGANVTAANELLIAGSGTAGTASSSVVTVQGVASMTPVQVALTTVASTAIVSGGVNGSQSVGGPTASGSSVAANPLTQGGRAATANPTAVADAQVVNTMHDKLGKLVAVGAIRTLKGVTQTQISNSTSETTIVAAVASTFQDIYGLVFANTGATTTKVTIKDDTAGTTRMIFEVPTLETRGFMVPVDSAVPQAVVNKPWTATCASATTAMEVTALWVSNI